MATDLLERLRARQVGGEPVLVSVGVCVFDGQWGSADEVLADADAAMYRAKQGGGGRVEPGHMPDTTGRPAPASTGEDRVREVLPEGEALGAGPAAVASPAGDPVATAGTRALGIEQAIRAEQLLLYAQPVFDLRSGDVAHYELLVRLRDEDGSILAASDFLGVAEQQAGLCTAVDSWVVRSALKILGCGARAPRRVQVNLSAETLRDDSALRAIAADVRSAGIAAGTLAFEVGEGAIDQDVEAAARALDILAATGTPIALDSFSASFGSFEYLHALPLEQIKLDGSLVRDLADADSDQSTLRAIVRLARGTQRSTVAKLVESEAVLPLLRMHGVDMAQGFELGEPQPVD